MLIMQRSAIMEWLKRNNTSPSTGLVLAHTDLQPATEVKEAVQRLLLERSNTLNSAAADDSGDNKPAVRKREPRNPPRAAPVASAPPAKVAKIERKKKSKDEKSEYACFLLAQLLSFLP